MIENIENKPYIKQIDGYNYIKVVRSSHNIMSRPKVKCGIKDIARECGVSPATVSRVFHQHPNVRESIRDRVFLAAEKFNYKLEYKSAKKVIGIILPDLSQQPFGIYHNTIIPPLVEEIHRQGYGVILVPMNDLELMRHYFIIGGIAIAYCDDIIRDWGNNFSIPMVVINSPGRRMENAFSVNSNEEYGMYIAVKHLVENGHKKIALLIDGTLEMNATKRKRYIGYMKAIKEMNCVIDKNLVQMTATDDWMHALGRSIRSGATALICCGESSGYKFDYVMNLFGKKIPDELSIITFENKIISQYCSPPHTTISQNFEQLAFEAVNLIKQSIKDPSQARDIMVDYKLVERDSVKKIVDYQKIKL